MKIRHNSLLQEFVVEMALSTDDLKGAGSPRLLGNAFGTEEFLNGWDYCLVKWKT